MLQPLIRLSLRQLLKVCCHASRASSHRFVRSVNTECKSCLIPLQVCEQIFHDYTSKHIGQNQKVLPDYVPVLVHLLNETKEENINFRQYFRLPQIETGDLT